MSVRAPSQEAEVKLEVAGKYRLFASLGRGGMADVFLANAHGPMGFNKLVVIKRLRAGHVDDPAVITMFLDEAKLAARLTHANIVHTYEVGEQDGDYFIAMEYLDGQPLHRIISRAKETHTNVPESVWLRIMCDALTGLHHAHEAKDYDGTPMAVVHRDISPHNIFVTYDGEVKIVDFGIAKAALNSVATEEGVLKGKIHYMSPEQALGNPTDRRADIYAAGGVLWELLAGERVQQGDVTMALAALTFGRIRGLREVAPNVSVELEAVVKHSMESEVENRFSTAEDFRRDLAAYAANAPGRPGLASSQEVASLVVNLFETDRKEIQRRIRDHLAKAPEASSSSSSPRLMVLAHDSTGSLPSVKSGASHVSVVTGNAAQETGPAAPGTNARTLVIAGFGVALLGVAIYAVARSGARAATVNAPVAASAPTSAALASANAKNDEKVDLTIRATPSSATLFVDGAQVGQNPYRVTVPKDGALHEIRAVAPGFAPRVTTASFDRDLNLELALDPLPELAASSRPSETPPAAHHRPQGAGAPPPTPSASASASTPFKLRTER